jgi:hypothetical protein
MSNMSAAVRSSTAFAAYELLLADGRRAPVVE